jgi:GDP-L-fucose synthase
MYTFKGKKVLVAGGTGLIGRPLVELLLEEGANVSIASRDDRSLADPQSKFYQLDLLKPGSCMHVCKGVDFVFNLLCVKGSPDAVVKHPAKLFRNNLLLSMNLLEAAMKCGVSGYQFASSVAVYEPAEELCEDDVWKRKSYPSPKDWFAGWAKRMGEVAIDAYRQEYDMTHLSVVRPTNIFGRTDNFDEKSAMVIPSLIRRFVSGKSPLVVWGDGSQIRDFMYADDAARAMLLVARHGPDYPVNIGTGRETSIRELVDIISEAMPQSIKRPKIKYDPSKPSGDGRRVMNISRLAALGFVSGISLEEGIRRTIHTYIGNKDIPSGRYDAFKD